MNRKPIAVIISDIHFSPSTLELATKALLSAQDKAQHLNVPLVLSGDTLDTKAVIRAECANRLIEILNGAPKTFVLCGNHDLLHEKSSEHSLNFLKPYVEVIDEPCHVPDIQSNCYMIPYQTSADSLQTKLNSIPPGALLICHQGIKGAWMGHYVQDKTSIDKSAFSEFRTISGHYHRAQNIKCGRPRRDAVGLFSYVGNPYTLSFAEANDGPKGYQVLYDDGIMEQVPLNLRRHVILEAEIGKVEVIKNDNIRPEDLVWFKIKGPKSELQKLDKAAIGMNLLGHTNYKLDLIPSDIEAPQDKDSTKSEESILDSLIDDMKETDKQKEILKSLWRELADEN